MGMVRIIAGFGSAAVAGNTIGIRVILFAAPALVGHEQRRRHARRPEPGRRETRTRRGRRAGSRALQHAVSSERRRGLSALRADHFASSRAIRRWHRLGVQCLRIVSAGFLFYGLRDGADGRVQRRRRHAHADVINLVSLWMLELPLAWLLAHPLAWGRPGSISWPERRVLDAGVPQCVDLRQGPLEDQARLEGC